MVSRSTREALKTNLWAVPFVYSILVLQSVSDAPHEFVPHLSSSVAVALALMDLGVLIYFIDHIALSIQLTSVVSSIARDFRVTLAELETNEWQLVHPAQRSAGKLAARSFPRRPPGYELAAVWEGFRKSSASLSNFLREEFNPGDGTSA